MKFIMTTLSLVLISLSGYSQDHSHHPKHNMILMGENQIFASHIVYKEPHNYQVLLQIDFDEVTRETYLASKKLHPDDLFILLLDPMDIKDITLQASISGTLLYENPDGQRTQVITNVFIPKENFKIIYFDEIPLSLKAGEANQNPQFNINVIKCDDDDNSHGCNPQPKNPCRHGTMCE